MGVNMINSRSGTLDAEPDHSLKHAVFVLDLKAPQCLTV